MALQEDLRDSGEGGGADAVLETQRQQRRPATSSSTTITICLPNHAYVKAKYH